MADAMLDARQEGDSYRRIEVITGQSRRRRWTAEEKARIVAESFETDTNISEVARRNGVARGLLTAWRHQFAATARSKAASFAPVRIVEESGGGTTGEPDHAAPASSVTGNDSWYGPKFWRIQEMNRVVGPNAWPTSVPTPIVVSMTTTPVNAPT